MKRHILYLILVLILFGASSIPARAELQEGIAAIVNDDVISYSDLETRTNLGILASSLPDTPEIRKRLQPQIISTLIDEVLKRQEAERLGISVSEEEVDSGFQRIADQNKMDASGFEKQLKNQGISMLAMKDQIKSQIAWGKVIRRNLRPKISVTEADITAVLDQIKSNAGNPEYLLAEIFLSVDHPSREPQVEALAERLVDQISKGAAFSAIARQFSQAPGAANGGDLGWVRQGQLQDELDIALQKMAPGQISTPIKTINGFHILFLRDRRSIVMPTAAGGGQEPLLSIKQLFLKIPENATEEDVADVFAEANKIRETLNNCQDLTAAAEQYDSELSGDLGRLKASDLPPPLYQAIQDLDVGVPSQPLKHQLGVAVLMVCDREDPGADEAVREQIATRLGLQRLEQLQQRYLQDLRATAFIDRRI